MAMLENFALIKNKIIALNSCLYFLTDPKHGVKGINKMKRLYFS